jgi:uncharacterized membrane protein YagU involved in acid resistance
VIVDAVRGAIAGAAATWAMDHVTTAMYEVQPSEVTEREAAAQPNGKSSVSNLIEKVQAETGVIVPAARRPVVETAVHYALGIVPGAIYGVLRRRVPFARAGRGLIYGVALFLVNDEYMNTKLGLAGPIEAYPPETHLRGFAGHAVLGISTESGIQLLGG